MRKIDKIIIHCSATPEGKDFDWTDIDRWHKQRGWSGIGYHYVIKLNGNIQSGRALEKIGAHAKGYNRKSIGVCYIGGVDNKLRPKDTRTPEQKKALIDLLNFLKLEHPEAEILGHRDLPNVTKACPSFHAYEEYKNL